MKKVQALSEILEGSHSFAGQTVVDVGCGTGDLVRWLTGQGARVTGLDTPAMLAKATGQARAGDEQYMPGAGEGLPLPDAYADTMIYCASLHHVPAGRLDDALAECLRVLKPGGRAVLIEPVAEPGSYYDITHLAEEETEARKLAYEAILQATAEFKMVREDFFYIERSFADFETLIHTFVAEESRWPEIFAQARAITERLADAAGKGFADFRFRSICRLNVQEKGLG